MADPITPPISDRICKHMNDDHADAVLLYAKVFANYPAAEAARLESIDPQGMNLTARAGEQEIPLRVEFERPLQDSEDAHHTLIDMVKQARQKSSAGS